MNDILEKKISVCKKIGGNPKQQGRDFTCEGVERGKFLEELDKEL